jgi:hypothetical protein
MRYLIALLLVLLVGCECRDYVPEQGIPCRWSHQGQELMLERTSPFAPPVAVCRCPAPKEVK